jgi:hypothetical protein
MNQRASQILHDARQEFAGKESYPSSQLRFKAENGTALNGGDIYLRDERDQVTGQPSTAVVRPTVVFSHGHLLEEVDEFWNLPLRYYCGTTSWRRRSGVVPRSRAPSHRRWPTEQREQRGHE